MSYGRKRKDDNYEKPDSLKQNETRQEIMNEHVHVCNEICLKTA